MKLNFYVNSEGKKVYTLQGKIKDKDIFEAHYKFIKLRDAPVNIKNTSKRE